MTRGAFVPRRGNSDPSVTAVLLLPYRLRAVRIGIVAQVVVVIGLLAVLAAPGGAGWNVVGYVAAALGGLAGIVVIGLLPWRRLFETGWAEPVLYVWSAADIALVAILVAVTGGAASPIWGVFVLTSIFFAASYPARAQLALHAATIAAYLGALAVTDTLVLDRVLLIRLMVLSVATYMSSFLARELMQQMAAHDVVHRTSQRRAEQIERIAEVARDIHHLDTGVVLALLVEAAGDLGYEAAGVARIDDGQITVVESTGLPDDLRGRSFPLTGSALQDLPTATRGAILEVHPERALGAAGFGTLIATPIRVGGEVTAVLGVAGRHAPSEADRLSVQPLELLAEIAGRALEHVYAIQQERDAVERLELLDGLKSDFISNASHELRTPTTVVYGLLHTLVTRDDELDTETRRQIMQRLLTASETLKNTVTTLIDFARIESGQLTPRPVPVDVVSIVAGVTANLTEVLADHEVSVDVAGELSVDADPILLDRALENLLTNAARYTPPGTAVRIRAREQGDEVHVTVADDGPGVPPEEQPHLIDRFFRGGDPNTRTTRGLGLGLAFVSDVVTAHGGRLDVASIPGAGSSFTLVLPRRQPVRPTGADRLVEASGDGSPPA